MGNQIVVPNGTANLLVASNPAYPCMDYSTRRNFDAATVKPNEISEALFGSQGGPPNPNLRTLPCFVDTNWKSPLPILYFRAARKFDSSIPNLQPIRANYAGGNQYASFYADANYYFTQAGNVGGFKDLDVQNMNDFLDYSTAANQKHLNKDLLDTVGGVLVPKGGFVLIAAGPDRLYGVDNSGNSDDIVVAGGN